MPDDSTVPPPPAPPDGLPPGGPVAPPNNDPPDEGEWSPQAFKGKLSDPEVQKALFTNLSAGLPIEDACSCAGISATVYYRWRELGIDQRDRHVSGRYREFMEKVEHCRAVARQRHVITITKFSEENPDHAKWLLQRMDPKNWGDRTNVVITQELEGAIERLMKEFGAPADEIFLERALRAIAGVTGVQAARAPPPAAPSGRPGPGGAGPAVAAPGADDSGSEPAVPAAVPPEADS